MEISMKSSVLLTTVIFSGLSAGIFFAWSATVIPGTQKVVDSTYVETMQSINRAILNPAFYMIFFGSMLFLTLSSVYEFHSDKRVFWILLVASVSYLVGTIGVTGLANVPLNDQLDLIKLAESSSEKITEFRKFYEANWNRWHLVRTFFAILSFLLSALAFFTEAVTN